MAIALATLHDFQEINRIQREAFATPWSIDLIQAAIVNKKYVVRVVRRGQAPVVGFYIAHTTRGKCNLDNLAVDGPLRGQGVGKQLIRDWIALAGNRQTEVLSLQVNTQNLGAQRLYQDFDFKKTRLLVAYYPNGDDAYQMEMALPCETLLQRAQ